MWRDTIIVEVYEKLSQGNNFLLGNQKDGVDSWKGEYWNYAQQSFAGFRMLTLLRVEPCNNTQKKHRIPSSYDCIYSIFPVSSW